MRKKQELYKTAKATISCFHFKEGDFVSVKYEFTDSNGVSWFLCNGVVMYPEHHLTRFCL